MFGCVGLNPCNTAFNNSF